MPSDAVASDTWRLTTELPSRSGSGDAYVDQVVEQLALRGWIESDQFAMRLALSEALENAVEHGNRRDESKRVHLSVELDSRHALASVQDEGTGFPVGNASDPTLAENLVKKTGRGLFLIRNFMTNVWHNEAGNVIYMEKRPTVENAEP